MAIKRVLIDTLKSIVGILFCLVCCFQAPLWAQQPAPKKAKPNFVDIRTKSNVEHDKYKGVPKNLDECFIPQEMIDKIFQLSPGGMDSLHEEYYKVVQTEEKGDEQDLVVKLRYRDSGIVGYYALIPIDRLNMEKARKTFFFFPVEWCSKSDSLGEFCSQKVREVIEYDTAHPKHSPFVVRIAGKLARIDSTEINKRLNKKRCWLLRLLHIGGGKPSEYCCYDLADSTHPKFCSSDKEERKLYDKKHPKHSPWLKSVKDKTTISNKKFKKEKPIFKKGKNGKPLLNQYHEPVLDTAAMVKAALVRESLIKQEQARALENKKNKAYMDSVRAVTAIAAPKNTSKKDALKKPKDAPTAPQPALPAPKPSEQVIKGLPTPSLPPPKGDTQVNMFGAKIRKERKPDDVHPVFPLPPINQSTQPTPVVQPKVDTAQVPQKPPLGNGNGTKPIQVPNPKDTGTKGAIIPPVSTPGGRASIKPAPAAPNNGLLPSLSPPATTGDNKSDSTKAPTPK